MSNHNLLLFRKKSKPTRVSSSANKKMILSASLMTIIAVAVVINASLLNPGSESADQAAVNIQNKGRAVASINPIFKLSLEKQAFQVLENTDERDLASIGEEPSPLEKVVYGDLEGKYRIRKIDGKISEIRFDHNKDHKPTPMVQTEDFLNSHLSLFSSEAQSAQKTHAEDNSEVMIERYQLLDKEGQSLGTIQILRDKNQNLLSMTVQ